MFSYASGCNLVPFWFISLCFPGICLFEMNKRMNTICDWVRSHHCYCNVLISHHICLADSESSIEQVWDWKKGPSCYWQLRRERAAIACCCLSGGKTASMLQHACPCTEQNLIKFFRHTGSTWRDQGKSWRTLAICWSSPALWSSPSW